MAAETVPVSPRKESALRDVAQLVSFLSLNVVISVPEHFRYILFIYLFLIFSGI